MTTEKTTAPTRPAAKPSTNGTPTRPARKRKAAKPKAEETWTPGDVQAYARAFNRNEDNPYDLYVALCQEDKDTDAVYEDLLAKLADPARERDYHEDRKLLVGALIHLEGKQAMLELINVSCPRLAT